MANIYRLNVYIYRPDKSYWALPTGALLVPAHPAPIMKGPRNAKRNSHKIKPYDWGQSFARPIIFRNPVY